MAWLSAAAVSVLRGGKFRQAGGCGGTENAGGLTKVRRENSMSMKRVLLIWLFRGSDVFEVIFDVGAGGEAHG